MYNPCIFNSFKVMFWCSSAIYSFSHWLQGTIKKTRRGNWGKYDDGFWVTAARQHLIQFNNSFIIIRHQAVVTHNYDQAVVKAEQKRPTKGRPDSSPQSSRIAWLPRATRLTLPASLPPGSPSSAPLSSDSSVFLSQSQSLPASLPGTRYLSLGCQRCNPARSPTSRRRNSQQLIVS